MESAVVYQLAQKQLANAVGVSAQQSGDTGSVQIAADSSDPEVAAASVNAAMTAYVDYLKQKANDGYTAAAARIQPEIDDAPGADQRPRHRDRPGRQVAEHEQPAVAAVRPAGLAPGPSGDAAG